MMKRMMKKSCLMIFKLAVFLGIGLSQVQAGPVKEYLEEIFGRFLALRSAGKYDDAVKLVSQPINLEYLEGLTRIDQLNEEDLRKM